MSIIKGFVCIFVVIFNVGLFADSIEIVYHIATLNNWRNIVQEQLETLESSGLWEACDGLTVTVVGEQISEVQELFRELDRPEKLKIVHVSNDLHQYEFPGIEMVQQIAQQKSAAKILYMHTKGLLHYKQNTETNVRLWRKYMEYFNMEKWQECIKALDCADICGVDLSRSPSGSYFSGNFWWARANYITTCKLFRESRYSCEQFVGTGTQPNFKSFHQSGENPKLVSYYSYASFPQYYHAPPGQEYFQGVMNLYQFGYLPEYYK
jgi:hypothetical protein